MSEKFEIDVTDFSIVGGYHYYGRVQIPQTRQDGRSAGHYHELDQGQKDDTYRTIKFWTIRDILKAARDWFLTDLRVKPGDKLVISRDLWEIRDVALGE